MIILLKELENWSEQGEKSAKLFLNIENGVIKTESENLL